MSTVGYRITMIKNLIIKTSTKSITMMIIIVINLLALIVVSSSIPATAVEAGVARASTTARTDNITPATATTSSGIELSEDPVMKETVRTIDETPINFAYMSTTYTGNGTLTLANSLANTVANFTTNGSALISFVTQTVQGMETLKTEDGTTATLTFYEIVKLNPSTQDASGIITAEIRTDPFGALAPLNDMVVIGIDDIRPNGESDVTFWEWESNISDLDIIPALKELDRNNVISG